jgi:hypothetical protein
MVEPKTRGAQRFFFLGAAMRGSAYSFEPGPLNDKGRGNRLGPLTVPLVTLDVPLPQRPSSDDQPGDSSRPFSAGDRSRSRPGGRDGRREMGGLSLAEALSLCELLAKGDPARYERAAMRWLERFIEERLPPLTEVALAASALAEVRHGHRNAGVETLKRLLRHG